MSSPLISSRRGSATALIIAVTALSVAAAPAVARSVHNGWWRGGITFTSSVFATGATITHPLATVLSRSANPTTSPAWAITSSSASRTASGRRARPSPTGNLDSTIVEFSRTG